MPESGQQESEDEETTAADVVSKVVALLTLVAAFSLLAVGWEYFWIAFPIGFGGVLPASRALVEWYVPERPERAARPTDDEQAEMDRLRDRYVAGDIDEAEFERRVERLLGGDEEGAREVDGERTRERA